MSILHHILPRTRARHLGIALLVAFGCAITLQGAFAATQPDAARSTAVNYADLDLSKPAGIETFYGRIQKAARKVCNAGDSIMRLYLQVDRASGYCYRRTVADAVARANRPTLTALHRVETGGPNGR